MKKHIYRTVNVKSVNKEKLQASVKDQAVVFAVDVAKEKMVSTFNLAGGQILVTMNWTHPTETREVLELVTTLPAASITVVMEPTCTYADCLRYQFHQAGLEVFQVNTKISHDYHEIHDGVPSSHDAKAAAVIAALHGQNKSKQWLEHEEDTKDLRALISIMEMHQDALMGNQSRLEHQLARHWPELEKIVELWNASTLELLIRFGSPQTVAAEADEARCLMRKIGMHFLSEEKIERVIQSARSTLGMPTSVQEGEMLKAMAAEVRRSSQNVEKAKQAVEKKSAENETIMNMSRAVGNVTAAVVYALGGNPREYSCAKAFIKALGLNLKVRSSGKCVGQLKITKRGPSLVRKYLYMAVLRFVQKDDYFKAWYERKVARDGGRKKRALVALMRKLAKALWHVAKGTPFRSDWLFDTRRLKIELPAAVAVLLK